MSTRVETYHHFEDAHIRLMEAITAPPARHLIKQSGILDDQRDELTVLDSAAGAGITTAILKEELKEKKGLRIVMGDLEKTMLDLAQKRIDGQKWENVEVKEANALALPFEDASFDYLFINFGLQLFPDQNKALAESYRVLKSSSVFGYTAWSKVAFVTLLQSVDPSFVAPPPFTSPVCDPTKLTQILTDHGFIDVEIEEIKATHKWENAHRFMEDMEETMKGLFADKERNMKVVEKLKEEQGEGEVELTWEGLAVTAKKA